MRRQLWAISAALVPRKHVFDFNQALMDFGATVCTARRPKCDACPMTRTCASFPELSSSDRSLIKSSRKRAGG
jgi:A/G-specific adenine glycosylase